MADRRRTGIVLAAGGSTRMGRTKALLPLRGRPVVAWHVERMAAWCDRIFVVVGAEEDAIRGALTGAVTIVHNEAWARTGQVDSLRLALDLAETDGDVIVTPVDVLPVETRTMEALIEAGAPAVPVGPEGRDGHPVLLDPEIVRRVREEVQAGGLRDLLGSARRVRVEDPYVAEDFDEREDWERLSALWSGQRARAAGSGQR